MVFYIYKIKDVNYIGSTNDIKERCRLHNFHCFNKKNSKKYNYLVYQYIREKNKNIELEILGVYKKECSDKIKKLVEQYYINKYDSKINGLNTQNSFTNQKKYLKKYRKKYYEKNKEKIKKLKKEYREKNKKKIKKQRKEYYEKKKEYHKKLYEKNKEKLRVKINCPICKSLVRNSNLKQHQRSKKCKNSKL